MKIDLGNIRIVISIEPNKPLDKILRSVRENVPAHLMGNKIAVIKYLRTLSAEKPEWFAVLGYELRSPYSGNENKPCMGLVDAKNFAEKNMDFPLHVSYID